jgi:hypothetical protein
MRSVQIALVAGLAITGVAVGAVLSESPPTVLAMNSTLKQRLARSSIDSVAACQTNERLPRGTAAIRLSLASFTGPRVTVKVLSGAHVVTAGEHGSAWSGQDVTVPVRAVSHTISPVTICFATAPFYNELIVYGRHTGNATAARTSRRETRAGRVAIPGRVTIEYLGEGHSAWSTLLSTVARHMGLGRAWSGTWIALLVAMTMLVAVGVTARLIVRELDE